MHTGSNVQNSLESIASSSKLIKNNAQNSNSNYSSNFNNNINNKQTSINSTTLINMKKRNRYSISPLLIESN